MTDAKRRSGASVVIRPVEVFMCDAVVIRISPDNLDERIEKAVHTIVSCWDDWDGSAQEDEQREQDPQAWYDTIEAQLRCVLLGMVIDDDPCSVPVSVSAG